MSLIFYENRNTRVRVRLLETEDGVEEPVPLWSSPNLHVFFRAFQIDDTLIEDTELTKVDPAGDPDKEGIVQEWILFDQEYPSALIIRFVLQNTDVVDADTLSGFQEEVFSEIKRKVYSSP